MRNSTIVFSLLISLVASYGIANENGKVSKLWKPIEGEGIPAPLVCDVGATGTVIGYTGHCGTNTRPGPAFYYTWPDNHYLYNGSFFFLGYKEGKLTSAGEVVNLAAADTFYWTSTAFDPTAISAFDTRAEWLATGLDLEVRQITHAWSESYRDDFIFWDFTFKNVSTTPITGFYLAQKMDCDISMAGGYDHWLDDLVGFYGQYRGKFQIPTRWGNNFIAGDGPRDSTFISYMWDDDSPSIPGDDTGGRLTPRESLGFIGTITIACPPSADGLFAANQPSTHTWWDWHHDPQNDEALYFYMAWGHNHSDAPYRAVPLRPDDYRYLCAWGPYDINPGEFVRIIVATGLGIGLEGMVENLKRAKALYFPGPPCSHPTAPPPPTTFTVVPGLDRIDLSWSNEPETETRDNYTGENDFEGYRLWKSEDGGATWLMLVQYDIINDIGLNTGLRHEFTDYAVRVGYDYLYSITSFDRGDPAIGLEPLESGRAIKATLVRPGTPPLEVTGAKMDDIFVAPNPYTAYAYWNRAPTSRRPGENRIGFFNLPKKCVIRIFTMAGDLVAVIEKNDDSGEAYWDTISGSHLDVVSGVYLYHVQAEQGSKMGKFVIIK